MFAAKHSADGIAATMRAVNETVRVNGRAMQTCRSARSSLPYYCSRSSVQNCSHEPEESRTNSGIGFRPNPARIVMPGQIGMHRVWRGLIRVAISEEIKERQLFRETIRAQLRARHAGGRFVGHRSSATAIRGVFVSKSTIKNRESVAIDDAVIMYLLTFPCATVMGIGLLLLDTKYKDKVLARLQRHFGGLSSGLDESDLFAVWETAIDCINENVKSGRFNPKGRLHGYVWVIAKRRALDLQKRRRPCVPGAVLDMDTLPSGYVPYASPSHEFIQAIRDRWQTLTSLQKRVMTHDVRLFIAARCEKWPSLSALHEAVNADPRQRVLTSDSVRNARARGHKKLEANGIGEFE
jgi:hypothetical protein